MGGEDGLAFIATTVEVSHPAPSVALICLLGEHDLGSEPEVTTAIVGALDDGSDVIVDLAETLFIDSKIISALISGSALATQRQRQLVLRVQTANVVRRALEITTVDQRVRTYDTVETAVEAILAARD